MRSARSNADLGDGKGMRNMARRMEMLGGSFEIDGLGDHCEGTRIRLHFPLPTNTGSSRYPLL